MVRRAVSVRNGDAELHALPYTFRVSFTNCYENPVIGTRTPASTSIPRSSRARSPGAHLRADARRARAAARGSSRVARRQRRRRRRGSRLNEEPLRFADEFVRHKILDCWAIWRSRRPIRATCCRCVRVTTATSSSSAVFRIGQPARRRSAGHRMGHPGDPAHHAAPVSAVLVDRILGSGSQARRRHQERHDQRAFFQGHFPGHPIMPAVMIIEPCAVRWRAADHSATIREQVMYFWHRQSAFPQP